MQHKSIWENQAKASFSLMGDSRLYKTFQEPMNPKGSPKAAGRTKPQDAAGDEPSLGDPGSFISWQPMGCWQAPGWGRRGPAQECVAPKGISPKGISRSRATGDLVCDRGREQGPAWCFGSCCCKKRNGAIVGTTCSLNGFSVPILNYPH